MKKAPALLLLSVLACAASAVAQSSSSAMTPAEQRAADALISAANQDRAEYRLPPLRHDQDLTRAAWYHARRMVAYGTLSHRVPGEEDLVVRIQRAGVHCNTVDENVAQGYSAREINDEWMHSPPHRANLLDSRVNDIGVAVIQQNGALYAVEDFAHELRSLTRGQQEEQVASLLRDRGLRVQTGGPLTAAYCQGSPHTRPLPRLIMRYSTTDLSLLPRQIQQGIASASRDEKYPHAVVGACSGASENGFAAYQMVILLY